MEILLELSFLANVVDLRAPTSTLDVFSIGVDATSVAIPPIGWTPPAFPRVPISRQRSRTGGVAVTKLQDLFSPACGDQETHQRKRAKQHFLLQEEVSTKNYAPWLVNDF